MENNLENTLKDSIYSDSSTEAAQKRIFNVLKYSLRKKYQIEDDNIVNSILNIQGLAKKNLDVIANTEKILASGMIENSLDQNSNRSFKSIGALINEAVTVPYSKIIGFRELYRKLKDLFGKGEAKRLTGEMYDYSLVIMDSAKINQNYSYYEDTSILIKVNDEIQHITLKNLFNLFEKDKKIFPDRETIEIKNLPQVWDTKNGWVPINRILRHKTDKNLILYQSNNGHFAFVTEDHPVILENNKTKLAKELSINDSVLTENNLPDFTSKDKKNIPLDLAYFIGYLIGSNTKLFNYQNGTIILDNKSFPLSSTTIQKLDLDLNPENLNIFIQTQSNNPLPQDIFYWKEESKNSLISGLIDSTGCLSKNNIAYISCNSYSLINQLFDLLRTLPNIKNVKTFIVNNKITELSFGVYFEFLHNSIYPKKNKLDSSFNSPNNPSNNNLSSISYFEKKDIPQVEYVYDITTGSGRFYGNGMVQHNCYSYDFSCLVRDGRPYGQLQSLPPKRLNSYVTALSETIHQLANETAGAVGIGSLFLDSAHILIYRERKKLFSVRRDKNLRKYIENCFQTLTHSINHLSRSSSESSFTNVSFNDRPKLEKLVDDNNMGYYFPKPKNFLGDWKKYVVDYIIEVQKIFVDFFDKGDPSQNGIQYRFPVFTFSITKNDNNEIVDKETYRYLLTKEIYRYNIMISKSSKFANCCLAGEQEVCLKTELPSNDEGEIILDENKHLIGELVPGKVYKVFCGEIGYKNGVLRQLPLKEFFKVSISGNDYYLSDDHQNILENDEIVLTKDLKVGDKIKGWAKDWDKTTCEVQKIEKFESRFNNSFCFEIDTEEHEFCLVSGWNVERSKKNNKVLRIEPNNGIMTKNCRLISDAEMFDMGGQIQSLGMSQISLGSHRVVSINLHRCALESLNNKNILETFEENIKQKCRDAVKILKAHKELLKGEVEKGYQFFFENGYIKFERLFSTIGIIGIIEASETLGNYNYDKKEIMKLCLKTINDLAKDLGKEFKLSINIEQVPAESQAIKTCKIDKLLYGNKITKKHLYANQMVSLWEDYSIWDRMKIEGEFCQSFTGGNICHINIEDKLTKKQSQKIIDFAVKNGLEHFALNCVYSKCSNNHVHIGNVNSCKECNSNIIEKYTRVVGFITPIFAGWSKERQEHDFPNRVFKDVV